MSSPLSVQIHLTTATSFKCWKLMRGFVSRSVNRLVSPRLGIGLESHQTHRNNTGKMESWMYIYKHSRYHASHKSRSREKKTLIATKGEAANMAEMPITDSILTRKLLNFRKYLLNGS